MILFVSDVCARYNTRLLKKYRLNLQCKQLCKTFRDGQPLSFFFFFFFYRGRSELRFHTRELPTPNVNHGWTRLVNRSWHKLHPRTLLWPWGKSFDRSRTREWPFRRTAPPPPPPPPLTRERKIETSVVTRQWDNGDHADQD